MGHAHLTTTMIYVHDVPQHDATQGLTKLSAASTSELLTDPEPSRRFATPE
jgi:hypothetical protein